MSLTRRYFLKVSAAAGASGIIQRLGQAASDPISNSPNERLGIAMLGAGTRANEHLAVIFSRPDTELLALCDVDRQAGALKLKAIEAKGQKAPPYFQDFRKALDDPRIDCVFIATPNHWHSLLAIMAMQAGKHVYVEKPVSHNVWEGRQVVNWARQLNKVCQAGTQCRSSQTLQQAVAWVQAGHLGKIEYAIGTCYKPRKSIGKLDKPLQIPQSVDYDLWCGPAEKVDLYRPRLHYDWHWDWNTGNGDMGNQGIHQMDIARWFLGEKTVSPRVMSIGGRVGYEDAGNTPNELITLHGYEKAPLLFETRGLPKEGLDWSGGMDSYRGSEIGAVIQCEKGFVVVPSYTAAYAYQPDGTLIQGWEAPPEADFWHIGNFLEGARAGTPDSLFADIEEGHISSALCHTGSISYRLGEQQSLPDMQASLKGIPGAADSFERMAAHLEANGIAVDSPGMQIGPWLEMDVEQETFSNHSGANALLSRAYRKGFAVTAPTS